MNRTLLRFLTVAAFSFLMLVPFPILALLDSCYFYLIAQQAPLSSLTSIPSLLLRFLFCIISAIAGYFLGNLFDHKLQLLPFSRKLASLPFLLLLVAGGFAFSFFTQSLVEAILLAILMTVYFCIGQSAYFYSYNEILSWRTFYISLGLYGGTLLFLYLFVGNPYGTFIFAIFFLCETLLLFLGLNQANIDFMMQRRKHRMDALPQKIRSFNLFLLAGIALVVVLLFLLNKPLGTAFISLGSFLLMLLRGLFSLLSRNFSGDDEGGHISEDPFAGIPDAPVGEDGSSGNWLWTAVTALFVLFLFFLVWYYRHNISEVFRTLYHKIKNFFYRLFFTGRVRSTEDVTDFYSEIDEKVLPEEEFESPYAEPVLSWREWKRQYRQFCTQKDSLETFRNGYRLILYWLQIQGVEIHHSDTTLEICRLSREHSHFFPDLTIHTQHYNQLRYGEKCFDLTSLNGLREALRTMEQYKKSKSAHP